MGVSLVISVDTGIRAFAAAEEARALGLDLIVTDHHLPDGVEGIPDAVAVINPAQPGCPYPNKHLCGAGVAFKLAHALLLAHATTEPQLTRLNQVLIPSFLKLVAIATIADSVSLTGENRAIVWLGLRQLAKPVQPGLRALMQVAKLALDQAPTASEVGFRIAPRINAAGRMDVASDVVELFLTRDAERANQLATKLDDLNQARRDTEATALDAIELQLLTLRSATGEVAMGKTGVPDMPVPDFITKFKADMDFSALTQWVMDIIPDSPVQPITLTKTTPADNIKLPPINALASLPPANFLDFSTGRSNIQDPGVAAAGGQAAPVVPVVNPGGAAPAQPAPAGLDTSWVTVSYSIPAKDLAKSFSAANVPNWTEKTTILEVHLWREEQLGGNKWSDPKEIPAINAQALLPLPAAGNAQAQQDFLTWAQAHLSDILQPAFFVVNKGDPWHAPGQVIAVQAVTLPALDPQQTYPLNVLQQYSDDDRRAYFVAHSKYMQSQRAGNRRSAAPQPPSDTGGPVNLNRPDLDSTGAEVFAAPMVLGPDGNMHPAGDADPASATPPPNPGAPAAPVDLATLFPIPASGDFDPNSLTSDIVGWAHDTSAEAGHTYRYMVTYRIKNPIFGAQAANIQNGLAGIFDILSPSGVWSKPISVASTTNFFVYANSRPGAPAARIKVYKWISGLERSHVFEVAPGDIIGGKDGDTDYSTGWTVVDLRFDDPHNPGQTTVIVMNPEGTLESRDYKDDQAKPELKTLDQQVSAASAADQLAAKPGQ